MLVALAQLTHLALYNNKIGATGAASIGEALMVNSTLQYLNLANDEKATLSERVRALVDDAPTPTAEAAWQRLGVPEWLSERLDRLDYLLPTRVQMHSLRASETGDDLAVCAPTGSGKTLGYVLPLLERLRALGAPAAGAPLALILLPTRELAQQVAAVCAEPLRRLFGVRVEAVHGGGGGGGGARGGGGGARGGGGGADGGARSTGAESAAAGSPPDTRASTTKTPPCLPFRVQASIARTPARHAVPGPGKP